MVKRKLSHLRVNTVVKAFIYAEMLLMSAWNFIMPIFSIFVTQLPHGNIEKAASAFSFYLFTRVIFGLLSGRYLSTKGNKHKFFFTFFGMGVLGLSYLALSFAKDISHVYFFYIMAGFALGVATPAKNSLFSENMKNEKATMTWSILDAGVFLSTAVATLIGGTIANRYGFHTLFLMAAVVNFIAIIPYLLYLNFWRKRLNLTLTDIPSPRLLLKQA